MSFVTSFPICNLTEHARKRGLCGSGGLMIRAGFLGARNPWSTGGTPMSKSRKTRNKAGQKPAANHNHSTKPNDAQTPEVSPETEAVMTAAPDASVTESVASENVVKGNTAEAVSTEAVSEKTDPVEAAPVPNNAPDKAQAWSFPRKPGPPERPLGKRAVYLAGKPGTRAAFLAKKPGTRAVCWAKRAAPRRPKRGSPPATLARRLGQSPAT